MENTIQVDYDAVFEQHYEQDILPFVKKTNHASCFDLMKEFHISYAESVKIMDTLEARGIVDAAEVDTKGPRPLLNGKKKRCLTSATSAVPTSTSNKESVPSVETVVLPAVPNVAQRQSSTVKEKPTAARKGAKRR